MGIKGLNNEPPASTNRGGCHCMASNSRACLKRLAVTVDCNDPVRFSTVSNIEQCDTLPSRHTTSRWHPSVRVCVYLTAAGRPASEAPAQARKCRPDRFVPKPSEKPNNSALPHEELADSEEAHRRAEVTTTRNHKKHPQLGVADCRSPESAAAHDGRMMTSPSIRCVTPAARNRE